MRTRSLSALTADILRWWPGATVWGKGDRAHQASTSDHNEDDTPGSKSEQTDADNVPEHRALDIPTLGPITMPILRELRRRLVERPANARRLRYVILERYIWRKRNGWKREDYTGEFHDHLHVSQDVADDNNASGWDIGPDAKPVPSKGDDDMLLMANVRGKSTVWKGSGLPGSLMPFTAEKPWSDTVALGVQSRTYDSAAEVVSFLGTLPGGASIDQSVAAVQAAG